MHPRPRTIPALLGTLACAALLMHVLLASVVIVYPLASKGNRLLTVYRRFVVLGPFFDESRIVSSYHMTVSEYSHGQWTPGVDLACREVASPSSGSRYRAVQLRAVEGSLARRIARLKTVNKRSVAVIELENFLRQRLRAAHPDSLAVAYIRRQGRADVHPAPTDTVFHFTFKP